MNTEWGEINIDVDASDPSDVVLWANGEFVGNVGHRVQAVGQVFDVDRAFADEIARRWALANAAEAERDAYRAELSAVMPADFADWHENNSQEWPQVAAGVIRSLREREQLGWAAAEEANAEIARLRAALAHSDQPCAYCTLPANEWGKCKSGFPGCARSDDAMGCPELGAALQCVHLEEEIERLRAALERLRDCDWVIPPHDRMDAVREIARAALTPKEPTDG
ncbi:MAG: hypothetical protein MUE98_00045 [Rhodobacteraceae bacterium]|jgi:hypothetical protein|nr:hypothetical protein [Paracoccaceae bacterium]